MPDVLLPARPVVDDPADARAAAALLADGTAVAHGFGNFYAVTARGDSATVRRVNVLRGRPHAQVGSITVPVGRLTQAFDLAALPDGLPTRTVEDVVEAFVGLGPFGFRGPAAPHLPDHLTMLAATPIGLVRTTQVIVPGLTCPSNLFLEAAAAAVAPTPLFVSSANRSRHLTGAADEPAHWRGDVLRRELAGLPGVVVLEHADEEAARARFPQHLPMSTTILGLHEARVLGGRLCLRLERHGSLAVAEVRAVLARLGLGLLPGEPVRLSPRVYDAPPGAPEP